MSAWFSQHFAAAGAAAEPISAMDQQMADMAEEEGVEAGLLRRRSTLLRARAAVAEQIAMRQVAVAAAERDWALLLSIVEGEEGAVEAMDEDGSGEEAEAKVEGSATEAETEAEAKAEDEGAEDPRDWGEAEEAEADVVAAPPPKVKGSRAKARAVAAGTWVGKPRNRHRGVLQSYWKRVGDWWGRGPPGGGPVSMIRPAGWAPPPPPEEPSTPGGASSSGGGPP
jgi:hypothetical protein